MNSESRRQKMIVVQVKSINCQQDLICLRKDKLKSQTEKSCKAPRPRADKVQRSNLLTSVSYACHDAKKNE